jgi:hypothetical protein
MPEHHSGDKKGRPFGRPYYALAQFQNYLGSLDQRSAQRHGLGDCFVISSPVPCRFRSGMNIKRIGVPGWKAKRPL